MVLMLDRRIQVYNRGILRFEEYYSSRVPEWGDCMDILVLQSSLTVSPLAVKNSRLFQDSSSRVDVGID